MAESVALRRRRNKSCDQCRAGKRRCDVEVTVHEPPAGPGLGLGPPSLHAPEPIDKSFSSSPCTNCKKWKKACTIEWIKSHRRRQSASSKRQRGSKGIQEIQDLADRTAVQDTWVDGLSDLSHEDVDSTLSDSLNRSICGEPLPNGSAACLSASALLDNLGESQYGGSASMADSLLNPVFYGHTPPYSTNGHTPPYSTNGHTEEPMLIDGQSSTTYPSDSLRPLGPHVSNPQAVVNSNDKESTVHQRRGPRPFYKNGVMSTTASPFTSQFLTEDHSRFWIKKGLLKIYHDSLEGALGCWLTERNCPYASSPFVDERDVWSSKWSNRIVTRVRALDDAYASTGFLSQSEQKQASSVLSIVVMAFAVQWAQSPYGKHDNLRTQQPEHGVFGRNMQKELWHRANTALNQAVGNPSFKVIFATIIFSLSQRPMDSTGVTSSSNSSGQQNGLASLHRILGQDNGPIFLDVAVRKLHDHQRRLKDTEVSQNGGHLEFQASPRLAMNRRTFALSDGETNITTDPDQRPTPGFSTSVNGFDCDLDGFSGFFDSHTSHTSHLAQESQVWGNYFLRKQSRIGDVRKQTTRWPCSYVDAAACLADAAPVKVLVFRRVGHLQDLYYQRAPANAIETAIASALEVYTHWNNTYGRFITDCVENHESLPPRIQSWYILLASHWHLGILILSDLIEKLDDSNMTLPANRTARQTTEFSTTLRFRSVYAISDLGRCSRFGKEDLSFSQSPDFHHAVNKAALLTEPWTVVLSPDFSWTSIVSRKQGCD
ncbi:hypothetical protein DV738_g1457, partial [Chaetothyriales sp. CBS 135597]